GSTRAMESTSRSGPTMRRRSTARSRCCKTRPPPGQWAPPRGATWSSIRAGPPCSPRWTRSSAPAARRRIAMPSEASLPLAREGLFAHLPSTWRGPLVRLATAWLALVLLTGRDWLAMADKWWNVSTYNHVLFVPPIVGWLVWNRRRELAELTPRAWWPGLMLVAGSLFLWLLGTLAGLNSASQLVAALALRSAVIALLGPRVAAGLVFPLAYMLFLVPFGDELVPTLQMVTADIVIWLTHASGIPAVIEGVFIDTPVG